jgi:hypothetical protein
MSFLSSFNTSNGSSGNSYSSAESWSIRYSYPFVNAAYMYALPVLGLLGLWLSVVCLIVLLHPKLLGDTYKLLVFKTLVHMFILAITSSSVLGNCLSCSFSISYMVQFYRHYFLIVANQTVVTCIALAEIALAYDRLCILMHNRTSSATSNNKRKNSNFKFKHIVKVPVKYILVGIIFVSVALNLPYWFAFSVALIDTRAGSIYVLMRSSFGQTAQFSSYVLALALMQSFVTLIVLILMNALVIIEFKRYMRRKSQLLNSGGAGGGTGVQAQPVASKSKRIKSQKSSVNGLSDIARASASANNSKREGRTASTAPFSSSKRGLKQHYHRASDVADRNFTLMILAASLCYTGVTLVSFVDDVSMRLFHLIYGLQSTPFNAHLSVISYLLFTLYFASNIFIYLRFNKTFRLCFRKIYLNRRFSL